MTDHNSEDNELTPEQWAAEVEEYIRDLIAHSLTQQEGKWVHRTDPDIWYAFDPITNEITISAKALSDNHPLSVQSSILRAFPWRLCDFA
jgi:hypothetical protein